MKMFKENWKGMSAFRTEAIIRGGKNPSHIFDTGNKGSRKVEVLVEQGIMEEKVVWRDRIWGGVHIDR